MKLNIGDKVTVKDCALSLRVIVEDASKGDIIQAKVETINPAGTSHKFEVGKVYSFERKAIQ